MPIRVPTSREQAFAWHTATLALFERHRINPGVLSAREIDGKLGFWSLPEEPQCGFYKRRLSRGGAWVAARIYLKQTIDPVTGELTEDEKLFCQIDGADRDPYEEWYGLGVRPIPESDFKYLCALADWVCDFSPDEPQATPKKPINLLTVSPPTFRKGKS